MKFYIQKIPDGRYRAIIDMSVNTEPTEKRKIQYIYGRTFMDCKTAAKRFIAEEQSRTIVVPIESLLSGKEQD